MNMSFTVSSIGIISHFMPVGVMVQVILHIIIAIGIMPPIMGMFVGIGIMTGIVAFMAGSFLSRRDGANPSFAIRL